MVFRKSQISALIAMTAMTGTIEAVANQDEQILPSAFRASVSDASLAHAMLELRKEIYSDEINQESIYLKSSIVAKEASYIKKLYPGAWEEAASTVEKFLTAASSRIGEDSWLKKEVEKLASDLLAPIRQK